MKNPENVRNTEDVRKLRFQREMKIRKGER
ncbi:MAG: hypothetical protein Ta2E_11920 [Mycoplasmoidaceae bacterium]|nr:MAG: hypothetical protein Ta2E_11920 [Mycoplasmoidaceae bacterium]